MTQNNKPEWFEITDADEKPELRKVSKSLPVSAVLVAALILGVGAVTAQNQGVTPLSASNSDATQTAQPENNPTAQVVTAAVAGTVATNKLANPAISQLPAGGDDDDDDDDHGRGHDDDDDDDDDEDDDEEGDDD